jgi:ribosomal protein S18 acetylase RimI-like enzyme
MTILVPMRPEIYTDYLEILVLNYVRDNVAVGRCPAAGAHARARDEITSALTLGLNTPNQFMMEIHASRDAGLVGFVWYSIERKYGACTAYICDLVIDSAHRRKGHALRALQAVEQAAVAAGASMLGLNVFARNSEAQNLYQKLGFVTTNVNMRKPL